MYKLQILAWWSALLLMLAGTVSTMMTFSKVSLLDFYKKMNFSPQQLAFIQQSDIMHNFNIMWYNALWALVLFGYLLYVRRFFVKASE
jgi:hypothetical protein